jgi:hypothetical protein
MYSYIIHHRHLTYMWSPVAWEAELGVPIQMAQLYLRIKRQLVILIAEAGYESDRKQRKIVLRRSFMSVTCTGLEPQGQHPIQSKSTKRCQLWLRIQRSS